MERAAVTSFYPTYTARNCGLAEREMKVRAAVALAAGQPLEIHDVTLDGPKAGEVLVETKADRRLSY
jgi:hypothetical protein